MRPGLVVFACLLTAGLFSVHALPSSRKDTLASPTRMFTLAGKSYSLEKSCKEAAVMGETLRGMGVDPSLLPPDALEPSGRMVDILKEVPSDRRRRPIFLPFSFHPDYGMQLDIGGEIVDIAYGEIRENFCSADGRVEAHGWKLTGTGNPGRRIRFAIRTEGKETSLGILEEDEGRGLFIRRSEK